MIENDLEDLKNDNNYNAPIIVKHYKDSRKHKKYDHFIARIFLIKGIIKE